MHGRRVLFVLLALLAPLLAAGPSAATPQGDAEDLVMTVTYANVRSQWGKVWTSLHPRYRRVTTRTFWEACQRKRSADTSGAELQSVRVIDSYADRITLPLLGRIPVTAVTVEAKVRFLGNTSKISDTVYVTRVGDRWFGLWEPETYRAYKSKRCPAA